MILRTMRRSLIAVLLLLIPAIATAQAPNSPAAPSGDQLLKPEQLEALVSPIALYPDSLLSNVLMAATYPLEIVQADRWMNENKNLSGDVLKAAVDKQAWDDSVKALVATPPVLSMMSSKLDWTQKLGDAVLAQQADVMNAVQRLRLKAQQNDKLPTTPQQKVSVQPQDNKQIVVIEQASDDTVYVPAYDPGVVYGAWPYADYPPYYWGYPGLAAGALTRGLWFGAGYALGRWTSGNWGWGGRVNWGNGNIVRNWPRATPYNVTNINNIGNNVGNNWQHNPTHRQGVRYNNASVQQRFGNNNMRAGAGQRADFRGHVAAAAGGAAAGAVLGGGANRGAQRPSAASRPAQRPSAAKRPTQQPAARQGGARRDTAMNVQSRKSANVQSARGQASAGARGPQMARASMGGARASAGGMRVGGGGGGGGFRGGGRRSDLALKHDVVLLGHLDNGLGFYRFSYNGSDKAYVGVIAQEVQAAMPQAVVRGRDGYLRVFYRKLGVRFETYDRWVASGAHVPSGPRLH